MPRELEDVEPVKDVEQDRHLNEREQQPGGRDRVAGDPAGIAINTAARTHVTMATPAPTREELAQSVVSGTPLPAR